MYDSIKITRVKHIEKTTSLQNEIENLKNQLKGKIKTVTSDVVKPKVSVFEKYAIDVEPLPANQRNNRMVHDNFIKHLRESLETLRKIVEEASSKKPSNNDLAYACIFAKRSQELLENVSASGPKAVNNRDKYIATTPLTRKKHVTFAEPLETSNHNTSKHVQQPKVKKTNVPISPICKLKDIIKSMREKSKEENVKFDYCEIETKNVELENRKEIVDNATQIPSANTIVLGMFKLDLEPLASRLLKNREAHIDYLMYTQEQADILRGIVQQAKAAQPLDKELDFARKHAQ
ncbi:hypothetical protein Tco_0618469 [Tanacetum coccineum]